MLATLLSLACCAVVVTAADGQTPEDCVSRQEFAVLKNDLHYWQNTTLSLIKNYVVESYEEQQCTCVTQLDASRELMEQKLDVILSSFNNSTEELCSLQQNVQHLQQQHGILTQKLDGQIKKLDNLTEKMCSLQQDVQELQEQQDVFCQKLDDLITKLDNHSQTQRVMPTSFPLGTFLNPAASCKNIPTSSGSGHYWIQSTSTGYATMEYCHMSPPCSCSRPSGWMRVAELNMTDPQEHCPSGFRTITSPKRMCGGLSGPGCASVSFPVNGVHYSRVCGRVIGYQYKSMNAFEPYYNDRSHTIDDVYVDGVSLTHGHSPCQHIWTFANAIDEMQSLRSICPCTKTDFVYTGVVPPFVSTDYFCDTGSRYLYQAQWYTEDPLWDGEGCGGSSTCCEFNNPPWFCKELLQSTTDDIELRLCRDQSTGNEDSGLELINIFVQ